MKKTVLTAVISVAATLLAVFLVIFLKNSAPKYPFKDLKAENVKTVYYTERSCNYRGRAFNRRN